MILPSAFTALERMPGVSSGLQSRHWIGTGSLLGSIREFPAPLRF
jgi:hypothetical protein